MIDSLHIENIAVVKELDVDFSFGLTVLSGETGAGKSIIMDSLGLLSGGRADRDLIRNGESRAEVSAIFSSLRPEVCQKLVELGLDAEEGSILLSRTVTPNSSTARINGRPVTVGILRELAGMLFNIHGQNDNQQLLNAKNHEKLLDSYAGTKSLLEEYGGYYCHMTKLRTELDSIRQDAMEQARLCEMLKFQISDIDRVKPKIGEDEKLGELAAKLRGAERIAKSCALVDKALRGGEKGMGASYLVDRATKALEAISDAIPTAEEFAERLRNIRYELEDIAEGVSDLADFGDSDPATQLDRIEERLHAIDQLKRKYGSSVEEILAFRKNAAERLNALEHADERCEDLQDELRIATERAKEVARQLTDCRKKAARGLTNQVTETLAFLDMPKVRFEVRVCATKDLFATGCDEVEFLISPNPGEPLLPMAKIASGGELARIMLALKNILNECDGVDTVIFDEIDTGISGKTSRKVGIKLKEIGKHAQVLCVTHSAQIASLAHNHLRISKHEKEGRTESVLTLLSESERVEEIARILGGIEVTELQRKTAGEMIAEGKLL